MRHVPYRMWTGYYLLLLAQQESHPKRILDVCCGTGTMAEMLVNEGFELAGFDLSPGMIDLARRKAKKRRMDIRYEVADATAFELGDTWDAAFSFFDSLNNILDPAGLEAAFASVFKHLKSGGSWIFDVNTAYAFEEQLFDQEDMRSNVKLRYKWDGDYDSNSRIITVDMRFWYKGEPFREVHRQRAYDVEEVVPMLEKAGFVDIHAYHSYTLNPPRTKSDRVHFTAIRP